jgi:hypothetical protein
MALIDLASFPNSRIKPRAATSESHIFNGSLVAGQITMVRPFLSERTYATLKNNTGSDLKYDREGHPNTNGFLLSPGQAIDLEGPQEIYLWSSVGGSWTIDEGRG